VGHGEYRIGCHIHKLNPGKIVDYPDLAVKLFSP